MKTDGDEVKTTMEHIETGVKYASASTGLAVAITSILSRYIPEIQPISLEIQGVLTVLFNLILIKIFKG